MKSCFAWNSVIFLPNFNTTNNLNLSFQSLHNSVSVWWPCSLGRRPKSIFSHNKQPTRNYQESGAYNCRRHNSLPTLPHNINITHICTVWSYKNTQKKENSYLSLYTLWHPLRTTENAKYSYSRHSESLGVPGQSKEFVEQLLSSLCILFIWPVFFKHQHFWSLWLIFQSSLLADDREQVFLLPQIKYVTLTALVKKLHLGSLRSLSW